jgi:hypothetical protein
MEERFPAESMVAAHMRLDQRVLAGGDEAAGLAATEPHQGERLGARRR